MIRKDSKKEYELGIMKTYVIRKDIRVRIKRGRPEGSVLIN